MHIEQVPDIKACNDPAAKVLAQPRPGAKSSVKNSVRSTTKGRTATREALGAVWSVAYLRIKNGHEYMHSAGCSEFRRAERNDQNGNTYFQEATKLVFIVGHSRKRPNAELRLNCGSDRNTAKAGRARHNQGVRQTNFSNGRSACCTQPRHNHQKAARAVLEDECEQYHKKAYL